MRLLFDEPLSEKLTTFLHDLFPESVHVRQVCGGGVSDLVVWEFARRHGCLIVTKDEDFHRLSVVRGAPPQSGVDSPGELRDAGHRESAAPAS